ncbi:MAG: YlxR family protein [Deltaproteobacteria bacterium]|nr:YlxR family protein [Deltaproteobacteria bacterium]MBW2070786.1 YlxR family protein [Deltaproteobacteria bacterium]
MRQLKRAAREGHEHKSRGHIPQRTCIACGAKRAKRELIRFTADAQGGIVFDFKQRQHGRGAYICKSGKCLDRVTIGRLRKALRRYIADSCWKPTAVKEYLESSDCGKK